MRHLEKNRCGWKDYKCTGIKDLFSDSISICCDTINYDKTDIDRKNDYNYLNLPTSFQGVVNIVPFADLSALGTGVSCISDYDPMQGGLQDYFAKVSVIGDYVAVYGDFNARLACYLNQEKQSPGVMTPKALLSPFNAAPSVVVPTSEIRVDPNIPDVSGLSTGWGGQSACANGFAIVPLDQKGSGYRLYVTGGDAIPAVNSSGQAVSYSVLGRYPEGSATRYKVDIQVYLTAKYNFTSSEWVFDIKVVRQGQGWQDVVDRQQWEKVALLGTVNCQSNGNEQVRTYVTQTACSPVDMRDFVSQVTLPSGTSTSMYVFAYLGSSKIKKWVEVKDC